MSWLYAHHLDNVAPLSTVTASAEDPAYLAVNLIDRNPGKPAKLTTTSGYWLGDFGEGGAQVISAVALWKHNFDPGLEVLFQANDTDAWADPALSVAIPIPALPEDDYPFDPWVDLRDAVGFDPYLGYRYWRLVVTGTNSEPVAVGDLWLSSELRELRYLQDPVDVEEEHPVIEHRTDFKVSLIYDRGVRLRALSAEGFCDASEEAALWSWYRACRGRARVGLLLPNDQVNDAWFMRFPEGSLMTHAQCDQRTFSFKALEVGKGLPL
jgi:hypothetical protein